MLERPAWIVGDERRTVYGDASVHWTCRKQAHLDAPSRAGRGGLVVHRGRWAYCDGTVTDTEHMWIETGGVAIDTLIDWAKAMAPWRATTVRGTR
jgi:hypothetical protein